MCGFRYKIEPVMKADKSPVKRFLSDCLNAFCPSDDPDEYYNKQSKIVDFIIKGYE